MAISYDDATDYGDVTGYCMRTARLTRRQTCHKHYSVLRRFRRNLRQSITNVTDIAQYFCEIIKRVSFGDNAVLVSYRQ